MSPVWAVIIALLTALGVLAVIDEDGPRWHRAWKYRRARRQARKDGYQRIIAQLMQERADTRRRLHHLASHAADNRDFAQWETEYCDSRPLPDPTTAWWDE